MRVEYNDFKIEELVSYWMNGYEFKKEGETLNSHEFYYDPNKGKVIVKLFINEADGDIISKTIGCISTEDKVIKVITEQLGMREGDVTIKSTRDSLMMDPLDDVEVIMAIEEAFDIEMSDSAIERMTSVKSIVDHVTTNLSI